MPCGCTGWSSRISFMKEMDTNSTRFRFLPLEMRMIELPRDLFGCVYLSHCSWCPQLRRKANFCERGDWRIYEHFISSNLLIEFEIKLCSCMFVHNICGIKISQVFYRCCNCNLGICPDCPPHILTWTFNYTNKSNQSHLLNSIKNSFSGLSDVRRRQSCCFHEVIIEKCASTSQTFSR